MLRRWCVQVSTPLVALSLLAMTVPAGSADALEIRFNRSRNAYRFCARDLVASGVVPEAAAACAEAYRPREISDCVRKIKRRTPIAAADALFNCRRVRRPEQLASCVVDITNKAGGAASATVLDHCRRSLLPQRFSDCVVGLKRQLNFPTDQLLGTCIDARDELSQIEPNPLLITPPQGTPAPIPTEPIQPTPGPVP